MMNSFYADLVVIFITSLGVMLVLLSIGLIGILLLNKTVRKKQAAPGDLLRTLIRLRYLRIAIGLIAILITLAFAARAIQTASGHTARIRSECLKAESLTIRAGDNTPASGTVLLETSQAAMIRELADTIRIDPHQAGGVCACTGELSFEFKSADSTVYRFSMHHGKNLRVANSHSSDYRLTNGSQKALKSWLLKQDIKP